MKDERQRRVSDASIEIVSGTEEWYRQVCHVPWYQRIFHTVPKEEKSVISQPPTQKVSPFERYSQFQIVAVLTILLICTIMIIVLAAN